MFTSENVCASKQSFEAWKAGANVLRVAENPVQRFPEGRALTDDLGAWCVAHAKPRQEKRLAHELASREIPYYLPLMEKRVRRRDNGKLRKTWIPVFSGYVSFAADPEIRFEVRTSARVAKLLEVDDQQSFVHELAQVQQALESGVSFEVTAAFGPGERVRVRSGPLLGLEGEVVRFRGKSQFLVKVNLFQQAVSVEIDETCLERA